MLYLLVTVVTRKADKVVARNNTVEKMADKFFVTRFDSGRTSGR